MTQGQSPAPTNSPELLQQAIELHRDGRFEEAARLYRETLLSHPNNSSAFHLLGVVEAQLGRHDTAVELIARAIEIDPANVTAHYNLGNALRELSRFEEALSAYDRSLVEGRTLTPHTTGRIPWIPIWSMSKGRDYLRRCMFAIGAI